MESGNKLLFNDNKKSAKDFLSFLFTRYGSQLFGYAQKRWQLEEDTIWDLVYKTLYKIAGVRDKYNFETQEKLDGFVFSAFINYIKNHFRDTQSHPAMQVTDFSDTTNHPDPVKDEDTENKNIHLSALISVLETLEDWQRILVLMRSDGYSYSEIAKYIDKPEKQLKVYYQRIKEQISNKINGK